MQLKINPEYEQILTPLQPMEFNRLKDSIKTNGQIYPVIVNKDGTILDGHNRFKACNEIGLQCEYVKKTFKNPNDEKTFVIESNMIRRHLNSYQRAELGIKLDTFYNHTKTGAEIAEIVGLGSRNYERARKVIREAPEEIKIWARQGDITIFEAYNFIKSPKRKENLIKLLEFGDKNLIEDIKIGKTSIAYASTKIARQGKHDFPPALPEGEFDVIYADPPWKYDLALRGSPNSHYDVMEIDDICSLKCDLPIADNAILFLWATNPKLQEAMRVIREWNFEYITNIVWVKNRIGTGYYVRGRHELLLIATRGNIPVPTESTRPSSALESPVGKHSSKPKIVYDIIEKMYPNRKYLELFSRNKRDGWTMWGNDVAILS